VEYDLLFRAFFIFVILELKTRLVIHSVVTQSPSDEWTAQQLREATPWGLYPKYLIGDHDRKYGTLFLSVAASSGMLEVKTPFQAPKANAICERFMGSLKRECLDHLFIINQSQLKRIVKEYVSYCNDAGHILHTLDGSRSWQDVTPPEPGPLEAQNYKQAAGYFLDAVTGWVVFYSSGYTAYPSQPDGVWRTGDGGLTWELSRFWQTNSDLLGGTTIREPEFTFIDPQHSWLLLETHIAMGSYADALYQTVDGGQSWQLLTVETHFPNNGGINFIDLQHGWAPAHFPFGIYPPMELMRTEDGGLTWESITLPFPDGAYSDTETTVDYSVCRVILPLLRIPQAGRLVVVCGLRSGSPESEGGVFSYNTRDGGQTWQITPLPGIPVFISDNTGWTLGPARSENQGGVKPEAWVVYHTQDSGHGSQANRSYLDC
jgi:hypothetical protein